ncbi:aldehyde dehydrogenase (NADP(+)) [Brucella sp. NBRC 113783]|uniref:aldehyde dehydrogenase (NADP(+)) n=1 Tax=Brucella sp. NBRC 113783 TaxID=3075478 RepID=UPI0029C0374C|nr:aldehyde dehydrogenase (NADP(+)) [Brucella sp. NBRC 113783]MDX4075573.1 aldehyde dehydrogenase (NADP(+)) [Brucella sp. NBRC 113783]
MTITGDLLIGFDKRRGNNGELWGIEASTGEGLKPSFGGAEMSDLDTACTLADAAFDQFRNKSPDERARFLERIADNIIAIGDELVDRCVTETGLPKGRIEGERGRTVGQLRLFASVLRDGRYLDIRVDKALPDRKPLPRPDIRRRHIGLGPVAVFGASNFPLAFSVAGGDTASALAAGCPVVVKAHSAHPGTSELVGRAVQAAVRECNMPEGTFSLLFDSGRTISQALVADPRIKAVGFTGSRTAGTAFMQIAASRPEPIPVYAEMSSINPVLIFKQALAQKGAKIGKDLIAALTLGAGQFCTNPGLVVVLEGDGYSDFIAAAKETIAAVPSATMLTPGICRSYRAGVDALEAHSAVTTVARGSFGGSLQGQAVIFETRSAAFLENKDLQEEVFGASTLIVRCKTEGELRAVLSSLEGQLTIALHVEPEDYQIARSFVPLLEKKAGRLIINGFGTGVEVSHGMVHGGPFPATSDSRTTSVGSLAIARFLRPVSYQSFPEQLLSMELMDENPWDVPRRVD